MVDWDRFDQEQYSSKEINVPPVKRVVKKECIIVAAVAAVEVILYALAPPQGYLALMVLLFITPFFLLLYAVFYLVHGIKSLGKRPLLRFALFALHILFIVVIYVIGSDNTNMYNPWSLGNFLLFL